MKTFILNEIFDERVCLGGKENGRFLRNEVEIALSKEPVCLDVKGLPLVTQSFSDEFLGPIIAHEGVKVIERLEFKDCSKDIQVILTSTAKRYIGQQPGVVS